jgi:hypothetical protein
MGRVRRFQEQSAASTEAHLAALEALDQLQQRIESARATSNNDKQQQIQIAADGQFERARAFYLLASRIRPGMGPNSMPPDLSLNEEPTGPRPGNVSRRRLDTAIVLLQAITRAYPDRTAYRQLLARCLRELASDRLSQRSAADETADAQGMSILEELVQEFPENLDYQFDLVESLGEMSVFGDALGDDDLERARERIHRSVELGEALVTKRPDVALFASAAIHGTFKLSVIHQRLAEIAPGPERTQKLSAAEQLCRIAIERQAELIRRFPEALGFAAWQAEFQIRLANICLAQRRPADAQDAIVAAVRTLEHLQTRTDQPVILSMIDRAYVTLEEVLRIFGIPPELLPARRSP